MAAAKQTRKRKRAAKPKPLTTVDAVKRDLTAIGKRDAELARSGLAASALALAREIDEKANSATSKSNCARAMLETLDRLRALAPTEKESDRVDDLSARRAARRKGKAAAAN